MSLNICLLLWFSWSPVIHMLNILFFISIISSLTVFFFIFTLLVLFLIFCVTFQKCLFFLEFLPYSTVLLWFFYFFQIFPKLFRFILHHLYHLTIFYLSLISQCCTFFHYLTFSFFLKYIAKGLTTVFIHYVAIFL